jgi:tetratricopeptide (TPR) repeat protein
LETLREFGQECLTALGEAGEARERHAVCFLALAEDAAAERKRPDGKAYWKRLEPEQENLRAALGEWIARARDGDPEAAERGMRLGAALSGFWRDRGYWTEGRARLAELLSLPASPRRTEARAEALYGLGRLLERLEGVAEAQSYYEESLAIFEESGNKPWVATVLSRLAYVCTMRNDYEQQRVFTEQALAIWKEQGDRDGISHANDSLGDIAYRQGDYARARSLWEGSLALQRGLNDPARIANRLWHVALTAGFLGDHAVKCALLEECLALARETGDRDESAGAHFQMSEAKRMLGDEEAARFHAQESVALGRELEDRRDLGGRLNLLGALVRRQGDLPAAEALFEESLALGRELQLSNVVGRALEGLGALALARGDIPTARRHYRESIAVQWSAYDRLAGYERNMAQALIAACLEGLAALAARDGDAPEAACLFGAAAARRKAVNAPLPPAERPDHEASLAAACRLAGDTAFRTGWREGETMTLERAVAHVLETPEAGVATPGLPSPRGRGRR